MIKEAITETKKEIKREKKSLYGLLGLILFFGGGGFILFSVAMYFYMLTRGGIIETTFSGVDITYLWLGPPAFWKVPLVISLWTIMIGTISVLVCLAVSLIIFTGKFLKHTVIICYKNNFH